MTSLTDRAIQLASYLVSEDTRSSVAREVFRNAGLFERDVLNAAFASVFGEAGQSPEGVESLLAGLLGERLLEGPD